MFRFPLIITILAFALAVALPTSRVFADEPPSQGTAAGNQEPSTGDRLKEGANEVKHGVVEGAHAVGDAAVEGAHQVRDSANAGAQQVKKDTHGLGDKIKQAASDAWEATKRVFTGGSSQKSSGGESK